MRLLRIVSSDIHRVVDIKPEKCKSWEDPKKMDLKIPRMACR
jgi:hypothetical protein